MDGIWHEQVFVFFSVVQKLGERGSLHYDLHGPSACQSFATAVALVYYVVMLDAVARVGEMRWYQRGPWIQLYARGLDAAFAAPAAAPAASAAAVGPAAAAAPAAAAVVGAASGSSGGMATAALPEPHSAPLTAHV